MGLTHMTRSFAEMDERFTKIACLSHYSEINCSDTYEEWAEFENFRQLYPFPKYTKQAGEYKAVHNEKTSLKALKLKYQKKQ